MPELSLWLPIWLRIHPWSASRFVAVLALLLTPWPVWSQSPAWQAGVAKVTVRADLNRQPGTAFVVAVEDGQAFLVTSAHVVEGDPNPLIEFVAFPLKPYSSTVRNVQALATHGLHGLALLVVNNPPAGLRVPPPSVSPRPVQGDSVIVAGYPAPIGEFTVTDTTVGAFRGGDLVLNRETGTGYSGGPVLRNGSVVGLVFGTEGRFGLAVPSSQVQNYLQEYALSWAAKSEPPATKSAKPVLPAEPKAGEVRTNPGDGQTYVWIPPGEFQMGCSPGDNGCEGSEKPAHPARITRGVWLGETEVTQAAYERVTGAVPSYFKGPSRPVESVTIAEAEKYCRMVGGRLPTEAEWEYAVRAGNTASRYGELGAISWNFLNSGKQTHPVKQKQPNSWGLYDMLGNVSEWVADGYYAYSATPVVDPKFTGPSPMLRGGCFDYTPDRVSASSREGFMRDRRGRDAGFRCALDTIP